MITAQSGLLKLISEMERFSSGQGMLILIWWMYLICEWSYGEDHFGEWRKLKAKPNDGYGKAYILWQNFWSFHHLRYKSWTSQACQRWEDYWNCWSRGSWWNLDEPWNEDESRSSMETTEEHCQGWDWEKLCVKDGSKHWGSGSGLCEGSHHWLCIISVVPLEALKMISLLEQKLLIITNVGFLLINN